MASEEDVREPIAVVGFALKFPGGASSPEAFWDILMQGRCASTRIPRERMNADAFYESDGKGFDTFGTRTGHFLEHDIAAFDAPFFSISAAEAATMDPQQRGLLETTYHALENAGLPLEEIVGSKTSVYTGCFADDYRMMYARDPERFSQYGATGLAASLLANRLSWFYDFTGASMNIDTACSSSLVALDLACQNLITGDSNMSIVGGCNLNFSPAMMLLLSNLNMLSPDGRSYSFDNRANGYARGEGISVVVLKRLSDALVNGDTIRAVIRSTGSNHNGYTSSGITRPSQKAQETLIRDTYEKAKLSMEFTKFIESHGTGTKAGDPVELSAIGTTFKKSRKHGELLYVGAVKSNIGHLEGASGLAGLIKAILILERAIIPPNTNFEKANIRIDEEFMKVKFPLEPTPWPNQGLRRVSVNGFGFGGANAHVVLDDAYHFLQLRDLSASHCTVVAPPSLGAIAEATEAIRATNGNTNGVVHTAVEQDMRKSILLVWSAKDKASLESLIKSYTDTFHTQLSKSGAHQNEDYLSNLAYTLSHRRSLLPWRSFMTVESMNDLQTGHKISKPSSASSTPPKLGFIFTGQGAQWAGMGRGLLTYSIFRVCLQRSEKYLLSLGCPWKLLDELMKEDRITSIHQPDHSQPMCTAIQIALVDLLHSFGIAPTVVVGHSSGEIAAAYSIGALSHESALRVAYYRGVQARILSESNKVSGAMLAVGLSEAQIQPYLKRVVERQGSCRLVVGCYNSPENSTISGDKCQIELLESILAEEKQRAHRLKVNVAYHSPHMNEIARSYEQSIQGLEIGTSSPRRKPVMVSTVTGGVVSADQLCSSKYWVSNMVSPVRFSDVLSLICKPARGSNRAKFDRSHHKAISADIFVEVGPHAALRGPIHEAIRNSSETEGKSYMSVLTRNVSASTTMLDTVGSLHCSGYPVDFTSINHSGNLSKQLAPLSDLPEYPFNHSQRYWCESRISRQFRFGAHPKNSLLGKPAADWNSLDARWHNFIRLDELPWVEDHKVQGNILYPAAGMLVMAIEAANQLADQDRAVSTFTIREAVFQRALVIPTLEPIETQVSLRRQSRELKDRNSNVFDFNLYSYNNGQWIENCYAQVRIEYEDDKKGTQGAEELSYYQRMLHDARQRCTSAVELSKLYSGLYKSGLEFGPAFQPLKDVYIGSNESFGQVQLFRNFQDTESISEEHVIHPVSLDGIMHLILATLSKGGSKTMVTRIPTHIKSLTVAKNGLAHHKSNTAESFFVTAVSRWNEGTYTGDEAEIFVLDQSEESFCAKIQGLRFETVASANEDLAASTSSDSSQLCRYIDWKPDIGLLNSQQVVEICEKNRPQIAEPVEIYRDIDRLLYSFIARTFREIKSQDLSNRPSHIQKYISWIRLQNDLYESGVIPIPDSALPGLIDDTEYLESLCGRVDDGISLGKLFVRVGRNLLQLINGDVDPLTLFFSDSLLSDVYQDLNESAHGLHTIRQYLDHLAHQNPALKILEVGAGTGGTTLPVLEALVEKDSKGRNVRYSRYDFTDISAGFFGKAREKFRNFGGMEYRIFDVERDVDSQGFEVGSYDLIIASNVLHATKNLNKTIQHVRSLLKPGGKLILVEITRTDVPRFGFAMGLLPGWWLGTEENREWSPCITVPTWNKILSNNGFSGTDFAIRDYESDVCHQQSFMVSTAKDPPHEVQTSLDIFIVVPLDDSKAMGHSQEVKNEMRKRDILVRDIISLEHAASHPGSDSTVYIFLLDLERPFLLDLSPENFQILQTMLQSAKNILWVTRGGGEAGDPAFAMLDGLARVARRENSNLTIVTVAFEIQDCLSPRQTESLCQVLQRTNFASSSNDYEAAYVEIEGQLQIGRIMTNNELSQKVTTHSAIQERKIRRWDDGLPLELKIGHPGLLDTLSFAEVPDDIKTLPPDDVEIAVEACGLAFHDCLMAMGELDGTRFGHDCAGTVKNAGARSGFTPGERVCGLGAGTLGTLARLNRHCVVRVPRDMSYVEAASWPLAFGTAYHALKSANISEGETVLIHSAAGGTGQAAVQLARYFGVGDIFATVGSDAKKQLLMEKYNIPGDHIFSSRDAGFAQGVKQMTKQGVDIVLNSLAGDLLQASWDCLAPYGRFLEIGKRDIISNQKLPMQQFLRNTSFIAVDLSDLVQHRPAFVTKILQTVIGLFESGALQVAQPIKIYNTSEVEDIFRSLQSGQSYGKLVVEMAADTVLPVQPAPTSTVHLSNNKTYLISGGLGGLGRSIARWMVERGAQYLILLSRSGPKSAAAKSLVKELETQGVVVKTPACNVADAASLRQVLAESAQSLPPIAGCIQAAMQLSDSLFEKMAYSDWKAATDPKVSGSWNLHSLLLAGLDFFVLLSSICGVLGLAGQSNYAAGNTFQDALARYRVARGERAVSLDLGAMASEGYLAENEDAFKRVAQTGYFQSISQEDLFSLLNHYCNPCSEASLSHGSHQSIIGLARPPILTVEEARADSYLSPRLFSTMHQSEDRFLNPSGVSPEVADFKKEFIDAETIESAGSVVTQALVKKLSRTLLLGRDIDLWRPMLSYGVDSLVSVELRNWIAQQFAANIPVFEIMSGASFLGVGMTVAATSKLRQKA